MRNTTLKDYDINPKTILSGLWVSLMFCYVYGDYFELYTPHKLQRLLTNSSLLNSPTKLLMAAVLMSIPALMVVLSLTLRPPLNRLLNILAGLIFTIIMVLIAIDSWATPWHEAYFLYAVIESTLSIVIVWRAIKWPRY